MAVPHWDFAIGEGSDVLSTLHFYVIGDPLAALAVFVPTRFMYLFYNVLVMLRLWLAGLVFSFLCFSVGQKNKYAVLAGSVTYVFCYWALLCAARHPFFLNPMIYMPLLILGAEKIMAGKRPYLFVWAVCFAALNHFYFFFMMAVLTAVYVCTKLVFRCRSNVREGFRIFVRVGGSAVLGLALSSVILLPICSVFLNDARMGIELEWPLFYPLYYYREIYNTFFTASSVGSSYWLCMGFSVPVFLAVCLMFYKRKKYGFLSSVFVICLLIIIFPAFGKLLNGFSYMGNRWSFAFALLTAYILTAMWDSLMEIDWKEGMYLCGCLAVYFLGYLFLDKYRINLAYLFLALALFLLILLLPVKEGRPVFSKRHRQQGAFLLLLFGICCNGYWHYSVNGYVNECVTAKQAKNKLAANETAAVLAVAEADGADGLYRFSGRDLNYNAGLLAGPSSTCYYWSLSNPSVAEYRRELGMSEYSLYRYRGYDERSVPLSLSSVLYYTVPSGDGEPAPYGFSYVDTVGVKGTSGYDVYRNEYALPFAYTYDACISEETLDTLSAVEQQEAMLLAAALDGGTEEFEEAEIRLSSREIPYQVSCGKGVKLKDHVFVVGKKGASVTLSFDGLSDSETYVSLTGFDFLGKSKYKSSVTLKIDTSASVTKTFRYINSVDQKKYNGRHDFALHMDYAKEAVTSVTITFPAAGRYSFETLRVFCQPMEEYEGRIEALREHSMEHVEFGTDTVAGDVVLEQYGFLCFSIPYSEGWSAYVDGEKANLYRANRKNMALALEAGEHRIELFYETPLLKEGKAVSCCSLLLFVAMVIIIENKSRKGYREEE